MRSVVIGRARPTADLLGDLLGKAMTGDPEDRLLTLMVANHNDRESLFQASHYGRLVVKKFMRQGGRGLKNPVQPGLGQSHAIACHTTLEARVAREVSLALGTGLGGRVIIGEYPRPGISNTIVTTCNYADSLGIGTVVPKRFSLLTGAHEPLPISAERPYLMNCLGNAVQVANFAGAFCAAMGDSAAAAQLAEQSAAQLT